MHLRRFLFTLFAICALGPPLLAQSTAKTFTLTGLNQCAFIGISGLPTVGIAVSGTFSLTLQPQVSVNGSPPANSQVTPSNSTTPQSTVTATGVYNAAVGGYDYFQLCVTSYSSGSVTVILNPSPAVNAKTNGNGGGSGTVTEVDTGAGLTGGPITSTGTVALLPALPNGETATTQSPGDNSTKVATDAFVLANAAGTVTNFTAGNFSPLFTTSVATSTSTPALTFSASNAAANTIFGNLTGSPAAASFTATQGTDNKVLTSGTVAGTGVSLCTDANGGATTSGCPSPVSSFSAGNLSPIFTTSVANPTTTPALTFSLSNAGANTIFGNLTGGNAPPSFVATQGTDSKVLTSGTVSGTGSALCTDANGGATTSGCPPSSGTVTNVGMTVPTGFSVSPSSISSSGTFAVTTSGLTVNRLQKAISGGIANSQVTDDGTNPVVSPDGYDIFTAGGYDYTIPNNTTTGTTNGLLACDDGTGRAIICPAVTSTTNVPIGFVLSGGGTTGNAIICNLGWCSGVLDNTSTARDYAIESPSVDGELHDVGPTLTGGQPNFFVFTSNAGAGTPSTIRLLIADDFIEGSTDIGTVTSVNTGYGLTGGPITTTGTVSLLSTLPNGQAAITQTTGDTSADVATDAFVAAALASSGLLPQSGCGVESIAGTLQVTVGQCNNYTINGQQYSSPLTTVTLATADPSNPRLDLIGVNTSGAVFVTTGTPAVNPVEPSPDPSTQFALTAVLVPAGATAPSLTVVDLYHDCLEWTLTSSGSPITTCSASNPYNGANPKSINGTVATTGNYAQLTDPASGTVTLPNYNNLVFYIDAPTAWPASRSLSLQWYNGSTAVGSPVLLGASGTFGFTSGLTGYQQVAIPTSLFNTSTAVGSVRITVSGTGATINFDIADITLQGGAASGSGGIFMTNRGAWNTTASYNAQNVVYYLGLSWIATTANTNSAPSASNSNWQQMTGPGTNQQVIYNCAGLLCGDSGMLYNQPTAALTLAGPMTASQYTATGSGAFTLQGVEGAAPTGVVGADLFWADSTAHRWKFNPNNVGAFSVPGVASAGTSGHSVVFAANGIDLQDGGAAPVSGTVTSFSAGNLSPLFTTSVATATSTPALSFSLSNAAANTIFGNFTGSSAGPSFNTINSGSNCGDSTHALSWTNGTGFGCQSVSGTSPVRGLSFTIYNPSGLTAGTTAASYALLADVPACTIQGWSLAIDTGTITVKFWKVANGTAIPNSSNSINTSGVSISAGTTITSSTLTDFTTTSVALHDKIIMDITAVTSASQVNGVLQCQ